MATEHAGDPENPADRTADLAASRRDRLIALATVTALTLATGVAAVIGGTKIGHIPAFLPAVVSVSIITFMLIGSLLWAQYRSDYRSAPLAILSLGFWASATLMIPYLLTYPDIFSRSGLLDAGPQSAAWLHISWHAVFCGTAIWYALEVRAHGDISRRVPLGFGIVTALVVAVAALTTVGHALLPVIVVESTYSPLYRYAVLPVVLSGMLLAAGVLIARTGLRSRSDVWLAVVLMALFTDTFVAGFASSGRYSVGWYMARGTLAICSTGLLVILQSQYAANVRRLVEVKNAIAIRCRQVEAFITLQDDIAAALPSRPAVINVVLTFAMRQTNASGCVLEIPNGDRMTYEAAVGTLAAHVGISLSRNASLSGTCSLTGAILLAQNCLLDSRVDRAACERLNINSMIVVPIPISGDEVAVLKVAAPRPYAFNSVDVQALALASKTLGGAIRAAHEFATLEASEKRYRILTNALPQLVAVIDATGTVAYMNERWRAYAGIDDALSPNCRLACLAEAGDDLTPHQTRAGFDAQTRLRRHDGALRWHSVAGVPLPEGYNEWLLTATDIEDRKPAQAMLSASALHITHSFDNSAAAPTVHAQSIGS